MGGGGLLTQAAAVGTPPLPEEAFFYGVSGEVGTLYPVEFLCGAVVVFLLY